jgi:formamidopyrimidine-DNA glycosylase
VPEGDTLWRTAAALRERIQGKVCRDVRPHSFSRLRGRQVTAVDPAGKHIFIRFDSGLSLHSHLRMHGAWHVYRPGEGWRRPGWEARTVLSFDDWTAVLFAAPVCEIVGDDDRVRHLGPDVLGNALDTADVITRVRATEPRPIGEILLDQRVCAGIGNIHKCDSLFALGINPWAPAADLDDATLEKLYRTARRLMRESAYGGAGPRRMAVHGRAGRPCRRCGHLIEVKTQGEQARVQSSELRVQSSEFRLTYWCPRCQGASRPRVAASTL